ncbi:MAG: cation diffusion facilitator family transporter [Candidatus Aenigmatarchaeota archaeon]
MDEEMELLKESEGAALVTTLATILLAAGKGAAGFLTGSLVLITDSLHSAVDIFPIFAAWLGLKISQKEADEKFPYGYYKAESIASLLISLFIIYVSAEFALEGYSKLFEVSEMSYPLLAGGTASVSIVVSGLIARYQKRVGEKTNSRSLVANARESFADVLSSSVVLVAIVLSYYSVPYVEGAVTILIALLVLKIGLETLKDSVYGLMDISPDEKIEKEVIRTLGEVAGVEGFGNLKLRRSGPFVFGEVTVMIRKFVEVERAHEIADYFEDRVKEKIPRIDSFTVHVEPYRTDKVRVVVPVKNEEGKESEISDHFGRAPYHALVYVDKETGEIEELEMRENEFRDKEVRAGLNLIRELVKEKIDAVATKEMGEISFHSLRDNLVEIYSVGDGNVCEAVEKFVNDELHRLEKPTREKD